MLEMASSCFTSRIFLFILLSCAIALADSSHTTEQPTYLKHQLRSLASRPAYKSQNVTASSILKAQKLVDEAIAQQSLYNIHRVENPIRNTYASRNSAEAKASKRNKVSGPPRPTLNSTVLAAAKLLAERDAAAQHANGTLHKPYSRPKHIRNDYNSASEKRDLGSYWVEDITHTGRSPMGGDPSYKVFRNVKDPLFGAVGDGLTDDTAAINAAIAYGGNCGANCESSSIKGTLIYFPSGTYLISAPINAFYYTQLVGNPNDPPIIKLAASFIGLGAIQTDVYYTNGDGGEWYIEQSNFYRQVRNFLIDITAATVSKASGFHWQVAQATSLTAVYVYASNEPGNTQIGMFTENGSGGFMSDCYFNGGDYGIYGGNQQYTVRGFEFAGQLTASICLLWDWGWTWTDVHIDLVPIGILLINPEAPTGQQAGSTYLMDTSFVVVGTAIKAEFPMATILESSIITLDNVQLTQVTTVVEFSDGDTLAIDPTKNIDFIVVGNVEADGQYFGSFDLSSNIARRPDNLTDIDLFYFANLYVTNPRNQYPHMDVGSIISVKSHGAVGDGVHDDSDAILAALALATTSNLIYFPAGSYLVTKTILIPPNSRITGEVWSQIVASGSYFADVENPTVMIQVGSPGDVGSVEISDMLFTSIGALPGLIMVEWNIQEDSQGSAAMWDSHFRVGGAIGTELQVAQCPPTTVIKSECVAATMMMHITSESSGYFENVWAWVADHDIDDPTNTQLTIAVGRGILIESAGPTWFYGTASEHSLLYQYNFYNATNSLAAMIQTESPYFQYTTATQSPGPFNTSLGAGIFVNDPIFPDESCTGTDLLCNFAWAVMVQDVTGVTIAGAGLYSWFDNLDQSQACVDAQDCQQRLISLTGGMTSFSIFNLITIGAVEMISDIDNSAAVLAKNNTQSIGHPFWSALGAYIDDSAAEILICDDDDTSADCQTQPPCDLTLEFDSLDALQAAAGTFPAICTDLYAIGALSSMLSATMANFTTVNDGYDDVFGDYVTYVNEMIPNAIFEYMADPTASNPSGGPGNKFFTCIYEDDTEYQNDTSRTCPVEWRKLDIDFYTIYYTMTNLTGFYDELESGYGVTSDWVTFGPKNFDQHCVTVGCITIEQHREGYPLPASNIVVPNPKDMVTKALPQIANLTTLMLSSQIDINLGTWYGPMDDVVQVLSMPVFMLMQAVDSMQQVKTIGDEVQAEDKKNFILEILGIIFAILPFVGEGLGLIGDLAIAGRVVDMISEAGNVGLSIADIVNQPASAPMAIMGLLAGVARTPAEFSRLAGVRRDFKPSDVTKMGSVFKKHDDQFQNIIKACKA